jgi:hypothetical protein
MRPFVACLALALLAGCEFLGIGGPDQDAVDAAISLTCAEVRSGIAAFNEKDYQRTVDHFTQARPFAQRYAELSDEKEADDLFEAVKYYAHLPAEEYRDAFANSRRFLEYKQITLEQCESGTEA